MIDQTPPTSSRTSDSPAVITSAQASFVDLGSLGVRFLAGTAETGGAVSIVEHPVPARTLAAPLHRHTREDEYSYVIEGVMGAVLGSEIVRAEAGSLVFKPRGQWHTFWNAGEETCRVLEIIAPAGFEQMFAEIAADPEAMTGERAAALDAKYGLEVDYESIERLCVEHGVTFPL
jgi:mannose-6-phosphate isomerase-like protein (cupin superfamily)